MSRSLGSCKRLALTGRELLRWAVLVLSQCFQWLPECQWCSHVYCSVTSLDAFSQCSRIFPALLSFYLFCWVHNYEVLIMSCGCVSWVMCNWGSLYSSLYRTAATTTLLPFITCSWSASRSIEAASYRVVQQLAVSKGQGAPRSAMLR